METANFTVFLAPNPAHALVLSTEKFVFSSTVINPLEQMEISTWDYTWNDWPNILGQGRWEYYCPDKSCPGPGWTSLLAPTVIKQVFASK